MDYAEILYAGAGALIGVASAHALERYFAYRRDRREIEKREESAKEIFYDLFGVSNHVRRCFVGRSGNAPHPDNLIAKDTLSSVLGWYDQELREDDSGALLGSGRDGGVNVFGGPNSTSFTSAVWEFSGEGRHMKRDPTNAALPLRWWGISDDDDPRIPADYRLNYLRSDQPTPPKDYWSFAPYPFIDQRTGERLAPDPDADIEPVKPNRPRLCSVANNYLLITKLPNFLLGGSGNIVVFEGNNGIGTRAAELLIAPESLEQLQHVKSRVGTKPFQAVFKATAPQRTAQGDRFTKLSYYDCQDLDIRPDQFAAAREKVEARLRKINQSF